MKFLKRLLHILLWYAGIWLLLLIVVLAIGSHLPGPLQALLVIAWFVVPGIVALKKTKPKKTPAELRNEQNEAVAKAAEQRRQQAPPPSQPKAQTPPKPPEQPKTPPPKPPEQPKTPPPPPKAPDPPKIDINRARLQDLESIPAVNKILARKILKIREDQGRFSSLSELFDKASLPAMVQKEITRRCEVRGGQTAPGAAPAQNASEEQGRIIDF